ncbi:MAG: glutathione S-transferase family protein [Caulobacterales bacterium]
MITLHAFGPYFGLPDPSPFVLKTMVQLKMSGLPHRVVVGDLTVAPKGKLPYIVDKGWLIADSVFIREHLERVHGVDFDSGLSRKERALAWAIERMLEDHLYWAIVHARWAIETNFRKGPAQFFGPAPAPVVEAGRARMLAALRNQGFGRHSESEVADLAAADFGVLAELLGGKPFLFGDHPSGVDATAFGFIASALSPLFESQVRDAAAAHPSLVAYSERMMDRYFDEEGAKAA